METGTKERINKMREQEKQQGTYSSQDDFVVLDSVDLQDPEPLNELVSLINLVVSPKDREKQVMTTILADKHWQEVLEEYVPKKLLSRGLGKHFNVLVVPRDRTHVLIGPGAVANIAEENKTGYSEVVYTLINATGMESNEIFERGCADLIAQEVAKETGVNFYANNYPGEAAFVRDLIRSFKKDSDNELKWVLVLKNNPEKFFEELKKSHFYKWWEKFSKEKDALSQFVRLMDSLMSPNGQLEASFLKWAQVCAKRYADFRESKNKVVEKNA